MFKFSELNQLHLEISNNCQASCPMCNRNIHGGLENPLIKVNNWSLEDFKQILSKEVLEQINNYYFCGSFGDPILNNDLIAMCEYSKNTAPDVAVEIHTNGGARSENWWVALAKAMPKNHRVIFAIDGLSDTHHLYRIGTKFETVIQNAKAFMSAGGCAEWVYIVFKHNEHQIDDAKSLAEDLGFSKFTVKNSSRFIIEPRAKVLDKDGNLTHYIEPSTDTPIKYIDRKTIESYKEISANSCIECKVSDIKEVYIDAHKNFYPCCWLANVPYTYLDHDEAYSIRKEMLEQHDNMLNILGNTNVLERSLKDIIDSTSFQTMWNDLWTGSNKMISCVRTCGKSQKIEFSQPHDQFIKIVNLDE